jgi:hypothetical protein
MPCFFLLRTSLFAVLPLALLSLPKAAPAQDTGSLIATAGAIATASNLVAAPIKPSLAFNSTNWGLPMMAERSIAPIPSLPTALGGKAASLVVATQLPASPAAHPSLLASPLTEAKQAGATWALANSLSPAEGNG